MPSDSTLVAEQASAFAVVLLRAHASGDGGENVIFANFRGRAHEVAVDDQLHELLDLHAYRTILGAARLRAFDATQRLLPRQFGGVAKIDFRELLVAHLRKRLGHMLPRHLDAFFVRDRIA